MYEEWPTIEFPDLHIGILDLFTRETGQSVASSILSELSRAEIHEGAESIRLQTEDQLRWCLQVLNHALTLPFSTDREFTTVEQTVRVYSHWLRALTDTPDGGIPAPLLDTPEKYFRSIIDALRGVFIRRPVGDVRLPLVVSRQAAQIDSVLEAVRAITHSASRKYQDEVWARTLTFMLNSTDLLLADPAIPDDIGARMGCRTVDTLLDLWLRAVVLEQIPSPSYWRTLSVLCQRWRHHVPVIECWSRKLLSLTVLVCQSMYGQNYCTIPITDDSVTPLGVLPCVDHEDDDTPSLLYRSWMDVLSLMGSPSAILKHDPSKNKALHGAPSTPSGRSTPVSDPTGTLPLCFFLATTAMQRMVDVFYGDNRVPIEFKETDILIRKWSMSIEREDTITQIADGKTHSQGGHTGTVQTAMSHTTGNTKTSTTLTSGSQTALSTQTAMEGGERDATLTNEGRGSFSSSVSGKTGSGIGLNADKKNKLRNSDRSSKNGVPPSHSHPISAPAESRMGQSTVVTAMSHSAATATAALAQSTRAEGSNVSDNSGSRGRPTTSHFVAHALSVNPGYPPFVGERSPKSERLLVLVMDWLLEAAMVKGEGKGDVCDDVISGLSLCSVDIDDIPAAMQPQSQERNEDGPIGQRRSYTGSTASSSGVPADGVSQSGTDGVLERDTMGGADGISAGRAAAVGALTRIVCSKSTLERLPHQQLAQYLAMLHEALIEKDRLVLCSLFYYGHSLFRLGLAGVESLLPHWLFALDVVLIESSKLRLHPSFPEAEMRSHCLSALATVISWPTTFGLAKIPQVAESSSLKSSASTYLHLRSRVYKTLIFSLRNETDSSNLQLTLSMCAVLVEESASFDLGLTEEQTKEMLRITSAGNQGQPEKGLCGSFVRGLISAICDRICRPEWAGDFSVCLGAIDVLNSVSTIHPSILFSNKDMSTGSLIVASLCRFIETQLMKPPPMHSKDLHSSVVAAYLSIIAWLNAAPMLAECESVLNTVAEAVQLGVTGARKHDVPAAERKAASKRVLDAAECLLFSLFCIVGRDGCVSSLDERRLLYLYGPSSIDTTRFSHFLVNGDTLLSVHEASHIPSLSQGLPCVVYVRRSPMQSASVGIARLRPHHEGFMIGENIGSNPTESHRPSTVTSSGLSTQMTNGSPSSISPGSTVSSSAIASNLLAEKFVIPPEFNRVTCRLDASLRALESSPDTDAIIASLERAQEERDNRDDKNMWREMADNERNAEPQIPQNTCSTLRVFLYDMGLIEKDVFGSELIYLDSGQSADFYRDLHDLVDSCPSRSLQTAHIFYVKDGQRSAVDILENALNVQNTCSDFCGFLSCLGEGIEIGKHDSWTGHWSTAYSAERKPFEEREAVDHYIIDGVSHALWWSDATTELAFLMPTERSVRMFKQDMPPPHSARSPRRSSVKSYSGQPSSDDVSSSSGHAHNDVFLAPQRTKSCSTVGSDSGHQPYGGGGSSMGNTPPSRRTGDLRVMVVWLERLEDLHYFPIDDVVSSCDDGGDRSSGRPSYLVIFLYQIEQGLIHITTRGSAARFGDAGPLLDGMVVSLSSLPSLLRLTLLNISRRNVAEIENYQLTHIKRRQSIADFGRKYAAHMTYEDFLCRLLDR